MHVRVIYVNIIYRYIERETSHETYIYIYIYSYVCICMFYTFLIIYMYIYHIRYFFFYIFVFCRKPRCDDVPVSTNRIFQEILWFFNLYFVLLSLIYMLCFDISLEKYGLWALGNKVTTLNPATHKLIGAQPNIQQGLIQGSALQQNN